VLRCAHRRPDGRVGVRNHVLVLSPTGLTSAAAQRVASLVRGTICVTSGYGRGQVAADAQLHFDTLAGLATHPNVAALVVMSAADDISRPYADAALAAGKPAVALSLPGVHEDALALVDAGVRAATRLVHEASFQRREPCRVDELCVAVECGHSDASSGIVCNPLAGRLMERIVEAGGQAIFSETVEWTGAEHLLAQRAATPDVARRILAAVGERERMVRESGGDIRAQNPGPQNKAGGLTTIEEKALGAIAKGGRQPIRDVLAPAQRPQGPGTVPDGYAVLLAGIDDGHDRGRRAHRRVHDRRGQQLLQPRCAPTFKMSANPAAVSRLTEQIDFSAASVLEHGASLDAVADDAMRRLLAVASGALTFGEIVGEGGEVISRIGASI
jgi:altronate dehydratase large subunit